MKIIKPLLISAVVCALAGCASNGGNGGLASYFGFGKKATQNAKSSDAYGVSGAPNFEGQNVGNDTAHSSGLPQVMHFGFNRYQVSGAQQDKIIHTVAEYLLANPNSQVRIAGYTDPIGSHEYNLHLGQKRADSVENALVKAGSSPKNLCAISYGELYPVAQSVNLKKLKTRVERILAYKPDRRVEFQYGDVCTAETHNAQG